MIKEIAVTIISDHHQKYWLNMMMNGILIRFGMEIIKTNLKKIYKMTWFDGDLAQQEKYIISQEQNLYQGDKMWFMLIFLTVLL